jgi:hypothetical protein
LQESVIIIAQQIQIILLINKKMKYILHNSSYNELAQSDGRINLSEVDDNNGADAMICSQSARRRINAN